MPKFLCVGDDWLNVESLTTVKVMEADAGTLSVEVWFAPDGLREYKGEEAKKILDYLRRNKVK